jgi:hypothetical protein
MGERRRHCFQGNQNKTDARRRPQHIHIHARELERGRRTKTANGRFVPAMP